MVCPASDRHQAPTNCFELFIRAIIESEDWPTVVQLRGKHSYKRAFFNPVKRTSTSIRIWLKYVFLRCSITSCIVKNGLLCFATSKWVLKPNLCTHIFIHKIKIDCHFLLFSLAIVKQMVMILIMTMMMLLLKGMCKGQGRSSWWIKNF